MPSGPQHEWTLLRAGGFLLDGGGMFGLIPKTMWSRLIPADALNRIHLGMNCVLLRRPGAKPVRVESGAGDKWGPKELGIYEFDRTPQGRPRTVIDALREQGTDPAEIGEIVLTHLHFDHAGGLTRLAPGADPADPHAPVELCFPNARVHVQRREWEDALANRSTMTRTYLRSHLDPIADRVVLHEGAVEALPGIHVRPLPGHTWGQQGVLWHDAQGVLCYPGDLVPTVHHTHPAASLGYDMLPYETMLTKRALLAEADAGAWRLVLDHEPGDCVVQRGTRA